MADESAMVDKTVLEDQYAGDGRLAARQSLWRLRTGPRLHTTVLDRAILSGAETIVDVGCGNGAALAELRRRAHAGLIIGLDLSAGMARQACAHAPTAVTDAQALPLADDSVDVALSLHMLYHVPDITAAVSELRRVLRRGGTALVTTNGPGHTVEAKRILAEAARQVAGLEVDLDWDARRFDPAAARTLLGAAFDDIDVHELSDTLPVPDPTVIIDYIASWPPQAVGLHAGPLWNQILGTTGRLITAHFRTGQHFPISSRVTVFRCR